MNSEPDPQKHASPKKKKKKCKCRCKEALSKRVLKKNRGWIMHFSLILFRDDISNVNSNPYQRYIKIIRKPYEAYIFLYRTLNKV